MGKAATQMTKPISERAQESAGNLPAVQDHAGPSAALMEFASEQTGRGVSTAADDNLVPLVYCLDAKSPQVDRRDGKYVEGAEAGDIWFRNAPPDLEIVKGTVGVLVQPCYFYKDVGEWVPRKSGGGLVCRHPQEKAKDVPGAKPGHNRETGEARANIWFTEDGDRDLIETRNHAIIVYFPNGRTMAYLMPLKSTGHSVSRAWMTQINNQIIQEGPKKGTPWDSFARLYHLTTEQRHDNEGNKWFNFVTKEGSWATKEQYLAGRKLCLQFTSGEKKAAADEAVTEPAAGGTNTDALA